MALVDSVFYVNYGNGSTTGYYALPLWALGTSYVCGNIVRQKGLPTQGNERCFVCWSSTGGTGQSSASTEPTWVITRGGQVTDNTVKWQECTGVAALNGDLTSTPNWNIVKNTAVTLGQVIQNVAGTLILICTTAGTAGNGAEPSWAAYTAAGATTADNTVTWTTLGSSFSIEAAPHARISSASTTGWAQAGNAIFVNTNSSESSTITLNPTSTGTLAGPIRILCHNAGAYPPVSANLTTGATVASSSALNLLWANAYIQGIGYTNSSGSNPTTIGAASVSSNLIFENCSFNQTGGITINFVSGLNLEWRNVSVRSITAGTLISAASCNFVWKNSTTVKALATGSTSPSRLIGPGTTATFMNAWLEGLDFSVMTAGSIYNAASSANIMGACVMKDCLLNAGAAPSSVPLCPGHWCDLIRSDSGATNYRVDRYRYQATETTETSITRVGGATQPDNTLTSRKIVTNASASWLFPYVGAQFAQWNTVVAANVTVSVYGTIHSATLPNNDEIWLEVEYPGNASSPMGTFVNTTKANVLAAGSGVTSNASTWNGGGSGSGWSPFVLSVVLSSPQPQLAGIIYARVKAAKISTTYYIDPQVYLS